MSASTTAAVQQSSSASIAQTQGLPPPVQAQTQAAVVAAAAAAVANAQLPNVVVATPSAAPAAAPKALVLNAIPTTTSAAITTAAPASSTASSTPSASAAATTLATAAASIAATSSSVSTNPEEAVLQGLNDITDKLTNLILRLKKLESSIRGMVPDVVSSFGQFLTEEQANHSGANAHLDVINSKYELAHYNSTQALEQLSILSTRLEKSEKSIIDAEAKLKAVMSLPSTAPSAPSQSATASASASAAAVAAATSVASSATSSASAVSSSAAATTDAPASAASAKPVSPAAKAAAAPAASSQTSASTTEALAPANSPAPLKPAAAPATAPTSQATQATQAQTTAAAAASSPALVKPAAAPVNATTFSRPPLSPTRLLDLSRKWIAFVEDKLNWDFLPGLEQHPIYGELLKQKEHFIKCFTKFKGLEQNQLTDAAIASFDRELLGFIGIVNSARKAAHLSDAKSLLEKFASLDSEIKAKNEDRRAKFERQFTTLKKDPFDQDNLNRFIVSKKEFAKFCNSSAASQPSSVPAPTAAATATTSAPEASRQVAPQSQQPPQSGSTGASATDKKAPAPSPSQSASTAAATATTTAATATTVAATAAGVSTRSSEPARPAPTTTSSLPPAQSPVRAAGATDRMQQDTRVPRSTPPQPQTLWGRLAMRVNTTKGLLGVGITVSVATTALVVKYTALALFASIWPVTIGTLVGIMAVVITYALCNPRVTTIAKYNRTLTTK